MKNLSGLSEKTIQALNQVFAKNRKITSVVLYGSRAKSDYKPGSDIDLTIHGDELTLSELLALETEIDDLLLPYKIDLSLFHQIENPELLEHIMRVGKTFYSRE